MAVLYQIARCGKNRQTKKRRSIPLRFLLYAAQRVAVDYFFALRAAAAATVAADAASFTFLSASVLVCFCVACFCVDFGDLSPIDVSFFRAPQKSTLDYVEIQGINTVRAALAAICCFTQFFVLFAAFARGLV